jgi:hypothetical protein
MKVLKCPICGTVKSTQRRMKTCSRVCGQAWLKRQKGEDFHRRAGRVAGRVSGIKTRQKALELWQHRWPAVPVATARAIYTQGFNSGHSTGKRLGFQQGYDAAISGLRLGKTA